jgi:DNA polymerase-3 subunit delta
MLMLYKQDDPVKRVALADIHLTTGDAETLGLDAVVDALLSGARTQIDRALSKALEAGTSPVGILRAAQRSFQRIQLVSQLIERGTPPDQALAGLIPPVPYSVRGLFLAACRRWSGARAGRTLALLVEAEMRCKTTGLPEDVICAEILLRLGDLTEKRPAA